MPRKSKPKPAKASNTSKTRKARPESSITGPSAKRRRLSQEHDSSSHNPESAQAPPELESPDDATTKLNKPSRLPRVPLPPPPPSVSSTYILLPPEADDTAIREKWDLHTTSLGGAGAKIEAKVRQVLTVFKPSMPSEKSGEPKASQGESGASAADKKQMIVALTARAPAGNKCISVAEIVKRDMLAKGVTSLWQYTGCWTRLETYVPPKPKEATTRVLSGTAATTNDDTDGKMDDTMEDDEEPAFETMQIEERKLVRNAVCLVIYLALEPVPRLKDIYGEQVFRPEANKKT